MSGAIPFFLCSLLEEGTDKVSTVHWCFIVLKEESIAYVLAERLNNVLQNPVLVMAALKVSSTITSSVRHPYMMPAHNITGPPSC